MRFRTLAVIFTGIQLICTSVMAQQQVIEKELKTSWQFKQKDSETWNKATVPGCVHIDLLDNRLIPDPYFRLNEHDLQWIDKKDWVYKTTFDVTDDVLSRQNIILDFKGLDTYAKVYLNGNMLLEANNMFREWQVDCKKWVKKTGNELVVEFESPINKTIPLYDAMTYHFPAPNDNSSIGGIGDKKVSMFTRKAGYQYGWDWGPRLVTSGIWRPIFIKAYDGLCQANIHVETTRATAQQAEMKATVQVESDKEVNAKLELLMNDSLVASYDMALGKGTNNATVTYGLNNPHLWWCNGLGAPYLYSFKSVLKVGNEVIDTKSIKIGVRTVEVVHEADKIGKSFYFKVNGIPVFMKGANYIPIDNFPSRITASRYEEVVNSAADANMNMLRIWGGGIYENDIFYDLCDQKGILIWHDFMFACSLYPGDDAFLENVKHEAVDNVVRLRNHPSIALWCGNNEIHTAWNGWGWIPAYEAISHSLVEKTWHDYDTLFNKVLKNVIAEQDANRFYWPSSPMADFDKKATDLTSGDVHYWDVWHFAKPFEEYLTNVGRFMSEYGFQSFPAFSSIKKYTDPEDYSIESDVMMSHQRHPRGNQLIKTYLGYYYKMPKDFENFLYVGQVLQAEGIKLAIEAHRKAMPTCMGTLYWQLNDCWPVASWSSTDYYGRWKALHYFVKKAYNPLLIVSSVQGKKINVSLISDKLTSVETQLTCRIIDFDGKTLWETMRAATFEANTSNIVEFDIKEVKMSKEQMSECVVEVSASNEICEPSICYFQHPKDLRLPKPQVSTSLSRNGDTYSITLKTDKLAKNIFVEIPGEGFLSDNYFDLLPGQSKTITVTKSTQALEQKDIKTHTLVESY